jgi:hypothetical protein
MLFSVRLLLNRSAAGPSRNQHRQVKHPFAQGSVLRTSSASVSLALDWCLGWHGVVKSFPRTSREHKWQL